MFVELPSCILSYLLSIWLLIRDIARLDSACCSLCTRKEFLQLCQRKEFSFLHASKVAAKQQLMRWLLIRRFQVDSIGFCGNTDVSLFAKVLLVTGKRLRFVKISKLMVKSAMAAATSMIAQYCPNIELLSVYACIVDLPLLELLVSNCHLKAVKIDSCGIMDSVSVPLEVSPLKSVQNLHLGSNLTFDAKLPTDRLFGLFPALLVLQLNCAALTNECMIHIVSQCPQIKVCILQECEAVTEQSLKVAVTRWPLQKLSVSGCAACSDDFIQSICDEVFSASAIAA